MKRWDDWYNVIAFIGNAVFLFATLGVVLLVIILAKLVS